MQKNKIVPSLRDFPPREGWGTRDALIYSMNYHAA
jgi:hypothetical protein